MNKISQAKVSIIIPIYNSERKIEKCISSIQSQTYSNIEIICVNDGSVDGSREIIERIALDDERVIVINKKNGGVSSARNRGLQEVTGKYVQFVDSDDYIDEDMVELLVDSIEQNDSQLVICGYRFIHRTEVRVPRKGVHSKKEFYENFLYYYTEGFVNSPVNKLYIKDLITDIFPENIDIGEDAIFNMRYMSGVSKISVEPIAGYNYSTDDGESLSWRYHKNGFYCEEEKDSLILTCLSENVIFNEKDLMDVFRADFERCTYNEMYLSDLRKEDVFNHVYSYLKRPFWLRVYFGSAEIDENLDKKIQKEIKHYIDKNMIKRYLVKGKRFLKKVIVNYKLRK